MGVCALITFQDLKERMVYWVLFPILGALLGVLYIHHSTMGHFYTFSLMNIVLVTTIVSILYLYTRFIARMRFLNVSFGLGDLLFFYALALGFPTYTFIILFVSAILFSLLVFLISKSNNEMKTIPLAGLMGLFLIGVVLLSFFPNSPSLYLH